MGKHPRIHEALLQLALQPRRLAKTLSGMMPAASGVAGLTVLALDGQWLRLLQVEGLPGGRRITKLLACPVAGAGVEALRKTFQDACATEGVAPREVLVATPTHLSTIRLFSLPSTDAKEIRDIVELQAEKHTPYAKDEVVTSFHVVERERSGYSRILLVIAHQDVVHRPVQLLESLAMPLDRVGCELEGLVNWFRLVKKASGGLPARLPGGQAGAAAAGLSLVIDVDANTSTLLLMQRGQPQFHRSLAAGVEQLEADPVQTSARLVGELRRSLEAVESEQGAVKLQDILLTGRVERLGEFKAAVERGLDLPVTLVPPWGPLELSEGLRATNERLPDVSFASLVGLALAPSQIDLTPQTTRLRQVFEAKAKALILLACQAVGALILLSILIIGRTQKEQHYYETLRGITRQTSRRAAGVEEALQQLAFVKGRLQSRGRLLELVNTLAVHSPDGVQWDSLTFTKGDGLALKGVSEELPRVYEFVAGLDGEPAFGQVEARRVAKGKAGEQDVTTFEIACPLAGSSVAP